MDGDSFGGVGLECRFLGQWGNFAFGVVKGGGENLVARSENNSENDEIPNDPILEGAGFLLLRR